LELGTTHNRITDMDNKNLEEGKKRNDGSSRASIESLASAGKSKSKTIENVLILQGVDLWGLLAAECSKRLQKEYQDQSRRWHIYLRSKCCNYSRQQK
jgi:hypothetical protein